jgi:hypothetical protein
MIDYSSRLDVILTTIMDDEPLKAADARQLIRRILSGGDISFSGHGLSK